ncbi:uncharacterized protein LOC144824336 [Lissotriton helveticus]
MAFQCRRPIRVQIRGFCKNLEKKLDSLSDRTEVLESTVEELKKDLARNGAEIQVLRKDEQGFPEKVQQLENNSGKNNLRLLNVPEVIVQLMTSDVGGEAFKRVGMLTLVPVPSWMLEGHLCDCTSQCYRDTMALLQIRPWLVFTTLMILFQLATSVPALDRSLRHSEGIFTNDFSKIRSEIAMKKIINDLLGTQKRSLIKTNLPSLVNMDISEKEDGNQFQEFCFMWLYQSLINNDSLSNGDAMEAAQISHKSFCPKLAQLIAELSDELSA